MTKKIMRWLDKFILRAPFMCLTILLMSATWCSCSRIQYVPVNNTVHDTMYINKLLRDSIYERDSIYIQSRNDTVFVEKYKYKYIDKLVKDTVYMSRIDSVQVPYPVEKQLTRWQSFKIDFGGIAVGFVGVFILIGFGYMIYKLRR